MDDPIHEHVARMGSELAKFPEGLNYILVIARDDWRTTRDPIAVLTISDLLPESARADLLEHLAVELRAGRARPTETAAGPK